MQSGLHAFTKSAKMKRTSYEGVTNWVSKDWNLVNVKTIKLGFPEAHITEESDEMSSEMENNFLNLFNSESDYSNFNGFE